VPVGVAGELWVGGEGLARGYRGRPGLTAERFVPDPFKDSKNGGRLYRTGDLARRLPDGRIEVLGRIDHQVKIRGYRIELAEVEAALQQLPGVQAAVVVAHEGRPGEHYLAGYLVPRGAEIEIPELRQMLAKRLPEYMVPAAFVVLESLPLTANGKIDIRALPAPELRPEAAFVAPRTPLEEQIAAIWQEILQVDRIGLHDSFWDLGGHSLLATKALARINEAFGVSLPLRTLFASPTLGELAAAVGQSVLDAQGEDVAGFLADLDGLSDEEIRALLAAESELQELA
jgi:acyl carrier protein